MAPRRIALLVPFLAFVVASAARGGESWQIMLMEGQEAGWVHTRTETVPEGIATTSETSLRLLRMGKPIEIAQSVTIVENAAGQIVRMESSSQLAGQPTVQSGVVKDGRIEVTTKTVGPERHSSMEWPEDCPGPEEVKRRLLATGFKPGATVTFFQFSFELGAPMEQSNQIVREEQVDLGKGPRKLVRVRTSYEEPAMPEQTSWLDETGEAVKTSTSMIGLKIETVETDREHVERLKGGGATAEIFDQSMIKANVRLPRPRALDSIRYRVRPKTVEGARATLHIAESERQRFEGKEQDDGSRVLVVDARVPPASRAQKVGLPVAGDLAEFLEPNPLIQSDDAELAAFALQRVAGETDAWRAAQKLERAVYDRIRNKNMGTAFASALEAFRTCEGDCSEHAVLLAALCRAAGIPSRVAMGLVYVGGMFGGHAWAEVSIDGKWYGLDGTLGRGSADPTHIELGATSLKDGNFQKGMLGVVSSLGLFDLEILGFRRGDRTVDLKDTKAHAGSGRFDDPIEGIAFDVPEGWTATVPPPGGGRMSATAILARLESPQTKCSLELAAEQVGPTWTLEECERDFRAAAGGEPVARTERRVAGIDGVALTASGDETTRIVAWMVDDTVYVLTAKPQDEAGLVAAETLLKSLTVR